jgi:hypothetical protein
MCLLELPAGQANHKMLLLLLMATAAAKGMAGMPAAAVRIYIAVPIVVLLGVRL